MAERSGCGVGDAGCPVFTGGKKRALEQGTVRASAAKSQAGEMEWVRVEAREDK